jgi:hypothetical protein
MLIRDAVGPARRAAARSALVLTLLAGSASQVYAHPKIEQARARIEAAEFDAALRLLAEAEAGSELTREDALYLLELRALVHLAMRDAVSAQATLRVLAVLAPEHAFAPGTSPDLVQAFARARGSAPAAPRIVLDSLQRPDGVHLRGRVEDDSLRLVRGLRLWTRVGDGAWRSTLADETIVLAAPGQRVEYRAVAEGIGGAPMVATGVDAVSVPTARAEERSHASPWLYAGIVTATVAIAGTVAAIALSNQSSERTQPSPPHIVGK